MINTIFYFPDSLTLENYVSQVLSGEIAPKTIVFARELKAIYKGGKMFGKMSSGDIWDVIKDFINSNNEDLRRYIENLIALHPYDDTELRNAITTLLTTIRDVNLLANSEKNRLDGVVSALDSDIRAEVQSILTNSEWIQRNFPQGVISWQSGWNDSVLAYLSTVGYWDINGDSLDVRYSQISLSINGITSSVASLQRDKENGYLSNAIESRIQLAVNNGVASVDLSAVYTTINETNEVIEWLYSGLKAQTSLDLTFGQLRSAGKNGLKNAISEIRTLVEKLKNGEYVALANLTAKVNDSISELYAEATADSASTNLFSKVKADSDDIALIATKITGDTAEASVATKIGNMTAGLVTTSNLDSAIASLMSLSNTTAAGIITKSTLNEALVDLTSAYYPNEDFSSNPSFMSKLILLSNLDSAITTLLATLGSSFAGVISGINSNISELDGILNGYTDNLNVAHAGLVASMNGKDAAWILATINGAGESQISIKANSINFDGSAVFLQAFANRLAASQITANNLIIRNTEDVELINISSYTLSNSRVGAITIKDTSNQKVAEITSDGRISFNRGRVTIPTVIRSSDGTYNDDANGLIVYNSSGSGSDLHTLYEFNGLVVLRSGRVCADFYGSSNNEYVGTAHMVGNTLYSKLFGGIDYVCRTEATFRITSHFNEFGDLAVLTSDHYRRPANQLTPYVWEYYSDPYEKGRFIVNMNLKAQIGLTVDPGISGVNALDHTTSHFEVRTPYLSGWDDGDTQVGDYVYRKSLSRAVVPYMMPDGLHYGVMAFVGGILVYHDYYRTGNNDTTQTTLQIDRNGSPQTGPAYFINMWRKAQNYAYTGFTNPEEIDQTFPAVS